MPSASAASRSEPCAALVNAWAQAAATGWSPRLGIAAGVVAAGRKQRRLRLRPGSSAGEAAEDQVVVAMSWFTEVVMQGKAGADREAGPPG